MLKSKSTSNFYHQTDIFVIYVCNNINVFNHEPKIVLNLRSCDDSVRCTCIAKKILAALLNPSSFSPERAVPVVR